jgi:hypothetical protein
VQQESTVGTDGQTLLTNRDFILPSLVARTLVPSGEMRQMLPRPFVVAGPRVGQWKAGMSYPGRRGYRLDSIVEMDLSRYFF